MENEDLRLNEVEEDEDIDEAAERSNAGALAAGIVGGVLAFAMIGGAKKLKTFIGGKITERRQAHEAKIVDAEVVVDDAAEQTGSKEETPGM